MTDSCTRHEHPLLAAHDIIMHEANWYISPPFSGDNRNCRKIAFRHMLDMETRRAVGQDHSSLARFAMRTDVLNQLEAVRHSAQLFWDAFTQP